MNRHGGALLATIIISMLLLSLSFWYFGWTSTKSRETTHSRAIQRAEENAESGLEAAQDQLMMPSAEETLNLDSGTVTMENGRSDFAISRDSETAGQVDVEASGYCPYAQGPVEDPVTHRASQGAKVRARLYVDRLDKLVAAVPGVLRVNPGTSALGAVYAADLVFVKGPENIPTQVAGAAFSHSMTRDDGTLDLAPPHVSFMEPPMRLSYPVRFPRLTGAVRAYYQAHAASGPSQLEDDASLDGLVDVPQDPDVPVYFCSGDLHVSRSREFIPKGYFIVYVTGVLHIHNAVLAQAGWAAFLAEKGIQIESDTPNNLELNGTFVTNGSMVSIPQHRRGDFTLNGSITAGEGIDLAVGWDGTRTYIFHPAPYSLPLPHLIERMAYEVVKGKYK